MKYSPHIVHLVSLSSRKVTSLLYILVLHSTVLHTLVRGCHVSDLGETYPSGDIVLHVGRPLNLICSIDLHNVTAQNLTVDDLIFHRDNQPVDKRYVTRVNETTISLSVENNEESDHMYYCYLISNRTNKSQQQATNRSEAGGSSMEVVPNNNVNENSFKRILVCMNMVAVGKEPKDVENFTCISHNWESLNCSWVLPKNYVKTNYTIKYLPRHRNQREALVCPNDDDVKNNFCVWTTNTKKPYRKIFDEFRMIVTGTNVFNKSEQIFMIQHFAHVLPNPPQNLRFLNKTETSILLQWSIGDLQYFPKNWTYKVQYTNTNDTDAWTSILYGPKNVLREGPNVTFNVTNLIPNTVYNFRVYMKSSVASDKYWSEKFAYNLYRTKASAPGRSPATDVGSFQFEHNARVRTVYVYWQKLNTSEYYGDNFRYEIEAFVVDQDGRRWPATDAKRVSLNHSFAKYEIGPSAYEFAVRSVNDEGAAPSGSSVYVPARHNEIEPCGSFSKTDFGNNTYELLWQPPPSDRFAEQIVGYTTFWCQTEKERPYQCDGFVNWTHHAATVRKHNFFVNSSASYQFAISANTRNSSSGMLWAMCTMLHGQPGTVKLLNPSHIGSTFMNIAWKLECWDQATAIASFFVHYCRTSSRTDKQCVGPEQKLSWSVDAHKTSGNITGLRPYSFYKVSIRMFTADKEGTPSAEDVFQTADGAPDVDGQGISLLNVTNVSATIGWSRPAVMNGVFDHYVVRWSAELGKEDKVEATATQYTLTNLMSYTNYTVTVAACTAICSKPMQPLAFRTRVGKPGVPTVIPISEPKGPDTEVWWNPPEHPAGPNPSYQLIVTKDNVEIMTKIVTNGTRTTISAPDCTGDKAGLYTFKVRAYNVEEGNETTGDATSFESRRHFGDWSSVYTHKCAVQGLSTTLKVLVCIFFPIFFAVVFFYGGRKCVRKLEKMKTVIITVPMKFSVAGSECISDFKGEDVFENYSLAAPFKPADEFSNLVDSNLVDGTTEQTV